MLKETHQQQEIAIREEEVLTQYKTTQEEILPTIRTIKKTWLPLFL